MAKDLHKLPRLYSAENLALDQMATLTKEQVHYLLHVLRCKLGDNIRIFNETHGEWLAEISDVSKKHIDVRCIQHLRDPETVQKEIHLLFAPIKKTRMDFLIEKSVELGVTHLHPVITEHTDVRKINSQRLQAQNIEASEQCERIKIPTLLPLKPLAECLENIKCNMTVYAAIERDETASPIQTVKTEETSGFLIGPEGGFSKKEVIFLKNQNNLTPISLGKNILRTETAALKILSCISDA